LTVLTWDLLFFGFSGTWRRHWQHNRSPDHRISLAFRNFRMKFRGLN
jgi:hypothetical protein